MPQYATLLGAAQPCDQENTTSEKSVDGPGARSMTRYVEIDILIIRIVPERFVASFQGGYELDRGWVTI